MPEVRLAVIGTGSMGKNHVRVARDHQAGLVAVCDARVEAATGLARGDERAYADVGTLVKEARPTHAIVATPTETHEAIGLALLSAGVHTLVEKPLAPDTASARRLLAAASERGLTLATGHVERHNPAVTVARDRLSEDAWGRALSFSSRRVSRYPSRIRDVGAILDIAIHDIDVMHHLAGGPAEQVYALAGTTKNGRFEDRAAVLLKLPEGVSGLVEANWLTPNKVRRLNLTCEGATVEIDYIRQSVTVSVSRFGDVKEANLYQVPIEHEEEEERVSHEEPLARELADFLWASAKGRPALADGVAGFDALAVAQAALRSAASGMPERPERLEDKA